MAAGSAEIAEDSIVFERASIVTPTGKLLVRELSLHVKPGHSMLVTGPNGSGKSSILRVLNQLWPLAEGHLSRPQASASSSKVCPIPCAVEPPLRYQYCIT